MVYSLPLFLRLLTLASPGSSILDDFQAVKSILYLPLEDFFLPFIPVSSAQAFLLPAFIPYTYNSSPQTLPHNNTGEFTRRVAEPHSSPFSASPELAQHVPEFFFFLFTLSFFSHPRFYSNTPPSLQMEDGQ